MRKTDVKGTVEKISVRSFQLRHHLGAPTKQADSVREAPRNERIYAIVRQIPVGNVATYGQIAAWAGFKGYARHVGEALAANTDKSVPWHRVVNAKGEISNHPLRSGAHEQRQKLEAEGVEFSLHGRIVMRQHAWNG